MNVGQLCPQGAALAIPTTCACHQQNLSSAEAQLLYPNPKAGKTQSQTIDSAIQVSYCCGDENHLHHEDTHTSSIDDSPVMALGIC